MEKSFYTTEQFAVVVGVKSNSIRRALCLNGHYLGLKPIKLQNGRLLWARDGIKNLMEPVPVKKIGWDE